MIELAYQSPFYLCAASKILPLAVLCCFSLSFSVLYYKFSTLFYPAKFLYNFFSTFVRMTAKDFLINTTALNLSSIAKAMWPNNKTAPMYLDKKLKDIRPWTKKDELRCIEILKALAVDIAAISIPE